MNTTTAELDLAAIKSRLEKSTPGPWVVGERYRVGRVYDSAYGTGRCVYCDEYELAGEFYEDYRGNRSAFHIHELPESLVDDYTEVFAFTGETRPVMVVGLEGYGYEGGVLNPSDTDFIVHARDDIPALIAEVERLNTLVSELMGK